MLSELRTFLAVVRFGSFAKAGDNIGLTQGAVSAQIRRLEEQVGVVLFDRSGRRAALTPEGREIHSRAEDIVASILQLGTAASESTARGVVVLGAITSAQQSWLIDAIAVIRREFPTISVRVTPGDSFRLLGQVDAGEIDLAVMVRPPFGLQSELSWLSLAREPFVLLVPSSFEGDDWQEAIRSRPFIRYERTSFGGRVVDQFLRKAGLHVQEAMEVDEIDALIRAVELGIGLSIVPLKTTHIPLPESVRVIPMEDASLYREIGVAVRINKKHPTIVDRLIELLEENVPRR
ncbi:LysR family transcriptional regulator [Aquabacter cavernae]|uniref:LysR family transcriptional regulator n=1 Tax=Aquabacter cavernae TaxID=2496029 RepID=UPI000F8CBE94|nr:LysR family transcriptional regulator [Aquabacter cavernae]